MLCIGRQKDGPGRKGRKDDISWQSPWVVVPFVSVSCFPSRFVGSYHIRSYFHTLYFSHLLSGFNYLVNRPRFSFVLLYQGLHPTAANTLFPVPGAVHFLVVKWLRKCSCDCRQTGPYTGCADAGPSSKPNLQRTGTCRGIPRCLLLAASGAERLIYLEHW